MEYTQIQWGNLIIQEPMTCFTDIAIFLTCIILFILLSFNKNNHQKSRAQQTFQLFFLVFGAGSLIGGLAHGFYYKFGLSIYRLGWFSVISGLFLLGLSVLHFSKPKRLFTIIYSLLYLGFAIGSLLSTKFLIVAIYIAFTLLLVVLPIAFSHRNTHIAFKHLLQSMPFYIAVGIIFAFKFSLSKWFNANDLAHIAVLGGLFFFYKAAKTLPKPSQIMVT